MILSLLIACSDPQNDPELDLDEDSYTNQQEWDAGSDPNDPNDVPYIGGWGKDFSCRFDVEPTGNDVGQIAEDFALVDQFGDTVHLHDFCGRPILLEFTAFTGSSCGTQVSGLEIWRTRLIEEGFTPMVIMYDGTIEDTMALAEEKDLNYPILLDTTHELFERWNPQNKMPSTTMIRRGSVVHSIDQTWYTDLIEDLVYNYP